MTTPLATKFDFDNPMGMPEALRIEFFEALKQLGLRTARHLFADLRAYGNAITEEHSRALAHIVYRYGDLAARLKTGRWAYGLDTGLGKTSSIVAWIAAMLEMGFPFSVTVATSQIEALCDIKRRLVDKGIDGEKIGLQHSKRYKLERAEAARRGEEGDYASLPATDHNDQRQILLATHERLRSPARLQQFNVYQGRERDLVIWDETLLSTESVVIPLIELQSGLGWLAPRVPEEQCAAVLYLDECISILEDEAHALKRDDHPARSLQFPERVSQQLADYQHVVRGIFRRDKGPESAGKAIDKLLDCCAEPVRLAMVGGEPQVIQSAVAVPDELKRMVILDASYPIRVLPRLDPTIQHDPRFNGRVKQYSRVTIHHWKGRAGRKAVERELASGEIEERHLSREIAEVVKAIPQGEGVLIFTFKQIGELDLLTVLRSDLEHEGVDTTAKLPDGHDRIAFLTWGRETSLNAFGYCRNVIFAGVLHRASDDMAGASLGQKRDLLARLDSAEVGEVLRSEVAHGLYQAMSRGSCRYVDGSNEARVMNVWMRLYDRGVLDLLRRAMPGVRIVDWEPVHVEVGKASWEEVRDAIAQYLAELPRAVSKVSFRRLKQELGLKDVPKTTFQRAWREALLGALAWQQDRSSLRRRDF